MTYEERRRYNRHLLILTVICLLIYLYADARKVRIEREQREARARADEMMEDAFSRPSYAPMTWGGVDPIGPQLTPDDK